MLLSRAKALAFTWIPLGAVKVRMLPLVPVVAVLPVRSKVDGTQITGGVTVTEQLTVPTLLFLSLTVTV